jgi:site-specific DNA recombinase
MSTQQTNSAGRGDEPRADIYVRVSTEDQAREGYSLGEQERRCRDLAEREGWQVGEVYVEAGVSGARASRPELDRLMGAVADGQTDVLIVVDLSRLARDAGIMRDILRVLDAAGVRVFAAGQALDRKSPEGRLQTGILSEFAEFERGKIAERTKAGIAGHAKSGKPWGRAPWPYRKTPEGHWEPVPEHAEVARRIVREYVEVEQSFLGVANRLNRDGIPAPSGGRWVAHVVQRLIVGRTLRAEYQRGGEWHRGQHEAVIDEATWQAAQRIVERGRKFSKGGSGRRATRAGHLFVQGTLRCPRCGEAMLPRTPGRGQPFYVCRGRKQLGTGCTFPTLKQADVDAEAFRMFTRFRLDFEGTVERLLAKNDEQIATLERLVAEAGRALATAQENRARVRSDYEAGRLSAEGWDESRPGLAEREQAAEAEHARLSAQLDKRQAIPAELADAAVYKRLEELAEAIGGTVRRPAAAADIPALRAAIARTFGKVVPLVEKIEHRPGAQPSSGEVGKAAGGLLLEATPFSACLEQIREGLPKAALELEPEAENNAPVRTITGKLATFHHQ